MSHTAVRDEIQEFGSRYQAGDVDALPEFLSRFGSTIRRIIRRAMRVKSSRTLSPFERRVVQEARRLMGDAPSRDELNSAVVRRVCELVISQIGVERMPQGLAPMETAVGWEICTVN